MRKFGAIAFFLCLISHCGDSAVASGIYGNQSIEVNRLVLEVKYYFERNGEYPETDEKSSWFAKIVEANGFSHHRVSSDGQWPLDRFGNPYIYESPDKTNGSQIVIRSSGENGVDDGGGLDDWDSRYGPNLGYWSIPDYRAILAYVWLFTATILIVALVIKRKAVHLFSARLIQLSFWLCVLAALIQSVGLGMTVRHNLRFSESGGIYTSLALGTLILICSGIAAVLGGIELMLRAVFVSPAKGLCPKCQYDLRGTIAANISKCPECGESVSADADKDVDLT